MISCGKSSLAIPCVLSHVKKLRQSAVLTGSAGRMALPVVVTLVLAVALVMRLAMVVRDWGQPVNLVSPAEPAKPTANTATVDLGAVQALGLFGGGTASAGATGQAAATTDLALSLEGVVVGSNPADSVAIIISNGQQQAYHVGDPLPAGVSVTLARIEKDHVILSNNGVDQTLWLYSDDKSPRVVKTTKSTVAATAKASPTSAGATESAPAPQAGPQQIKQATARLAEIIEVSPAVSNGQLVGYLLSPGNRLKDFVQLGFKTNDIVTAVNGIALNDMANLPELYRLMNESGDVSFSLLRDGEPVTLQMTMAP